MFQFGHVRAPNFFPIPTLLTVPLALRNPLYPKKCFEIFRGQFMSQECPGLEGGVLPSHPGYLRMTRLDGIFLAGASP